MMKIIVTCGPSFEPIDEVRRITNFSTGELGVRLANRLAGDGHEVFCLRGVNATWPGQLEGATPVAFGTNDDLLRELQRLSEQAQIDAVLHAAALADYRVKQVTDSHGWRCGDAKISSRSGNLIVELEPATKVISRMRRLFPRALIVGWKYELDGTPDAAFARAWQQLKDNATDACVLNGRAYGTGFAFCTPPDRVHPVAGKLELSEFLSEWLRGSD